MEGGSGRACGQQGRAAQGIRGNGEARIDATRCRQRTAIHDVQVVEPAVTASSVQWRRRGIVAPADSAKGMRERADRAGKARDGPRRVQDASRTVREGVACLAITPGVLVVHGQAGQAKSIRLRPVDRDTAALLRLIVGNAEQGCRTREALAGSGGQPAPKALPQVAACRPAASPTAAAIVTVMVPPFRVCAHRSPVACDADTVPSRGQGRIKTVCTRLPCGTPAGTFGLCTAPVPCLWAAP